MDLFAVPFSEGALPVDPASQLNHLKQYPILTGSSPLTYMNSTAGKISLNSRIPRQEPNFQFRGARSNIAAASIVRKHVGGTTQFTASSPAGYNATTIAQAILAYEQANGSFCLRRTNLRGTGVADTGNEWERAIIRNLGSLITTRSNTFSVWGTAQTIKKNPANNSPSKRGFLKVGPPGRSANDAITGEKRFHAVVERYVWPGVDGLAGNGSTTSGNYNGLGADAWLASPAMLRTALTLQHQISRNQYIHRLQ